VLIVPYRVDQVFMLVNNSSLTVTVVVFRTVSDEVIRITVSQHALHAKLPVFPRYCDENF